MIKSTEMTVKIEVNTETGRAQIIAPGIEGVLKELDPRILTIDPDRLYLYLKHEDDEGGFTAKAVMYIYRR